jgi:hypothetical protein
MLGGKNPLQHGRERFSGEIAGPSARFSTIASKRINPGIGKGAKLVL